MRQRDGWMIFSCILSLLFSILTLLPGYKKGVLNSVAIMTYSYPFNSTLAAAAENWTYAENSSDPEIQALRHLPYHDDFFTWFFEIHYLSICAGYEGEDEDAYYYHLNCSSRPGSYKLRTDDPFIVNYQAIEGERPVAAGVVR